MLIDLHVHTDISPCSRLALPEILAHARDKGLDGVCITDHDCMEARFSVREGVQHDGLVIIVGMEYATPQGDFLLFGPFEGLKPGLPAREVLGMVREAGGAAVAAHPCRTTRPADAALSRSGLLAAVERVNGRNTARENAQAKEWELAVRRQGLHSVAGSDAHGLKELGRAPTRFFTPVRTRNQLIDAIRQGQCAPATQPPLPGVLHPVQANRIAPLLSAHAAIPKPVGG